MEVSEQRKPRSKGARVPPHNLAAEESLLGCLLLSKDAVAECLPLVSVQDFYKPHHQYVYDTICGLHRLGIGIDAVTVAEELRRSGLLDEVGGGEFLLELQNATPAVSNATRYAKTVVDTAQLRQLIFIAVDLSEDAYNEKDIADTVSEAKAKLDVLEIRGGVRVDVIQGRDFVQAEAEPHDWVQPYIMERDDRLLLTGGEGSKKSLLMLQLAVMTACGQHWWSRVPVPAKRALMLDLEIGRKRTRRRFDLFAEEAAWSKENWWDNLVVRSKPEDIDLTTRAGASWLASIVEAAGPDIIFIGPIYRLTSGIAKAGDIGGEDQAKRAAFALDKIRERFGCALMAETHAAKGDVGRARDLRPFGSSVWTRWPEFGYGLMRQSADAPGYDVENREWQAWRGDRDPRAWPSHFTWHPNEAGWPMRAQFETTPWWSKLLNQGNFSGVATKQFAHPVPGVLELDDDPDPVYGHLSPNDHDGEDF